MNFSSTRADAAPSPAGHPLAYPGEITMMFTDIVGSSPIKRLLGSTEEQQDAAWVEQFQRQHHEIIRNCLARHRGREVKTIGDAFFATFEDHAAAVRCAVEIQERLHAAAIPTPLPESPQLSVRIGLHTSRPVPQGVDYVGTSVDLAARIESAAIGGQILVSRRTRDLAAPGCPEITFYEQGEFPLKGMGVHVLFEPLAPNRRPKRTGQRELRRYCETEKNRVLDERAPGLRNLKVRDAVAGDLFTAAPWKDASGHPRGDDLCDHILNILSAPQAANVMLLGQPGQGKTNILKRVFLLLCDRLLSGESQTIPIYFPLRECCASPADDSGSRRWLWNYLAKEAATRLPLDFEQFELLSAARRFVLLLDGFDELELPTQAAVNRVLQWPLFDLPAIVTCRRNYYDLFLRASRLDERYEPCELTPWDVEDAGFRYITAFAQLRAAEPAGPLEAIMQSDSTRQLAGRPLLLTMMLDILLSSTDDRSEAATSLAGLYEEYVENWLAYEAGKPGSVLDAEEKSALLQSLAWSLHVTRRSNAEAYGDCCATTVCTRQELQQLVKTHFQPGRGRTVADAVHDLRLRSVLTEDRRNRIAFLHMSFLEFYVARHIFDCIARNAAAVADVFRELIPLEVGSFLLDMLAPSRLPLSLRERISTNLIEAAEQFCGATDEAVHVREHAVFYLATLQTEKGRRFLESRCSSETNKVIQRSMLVGLGLFWKCRDVIDDYVRCLHHDPEAAEVNLGYHLVYFGDQPRDDGYRDAGRACSRTIAAVVRHLRDPAYESIWPLDLLTLRMLVERRGPQVLPPADVRFLHERASHLPQSTTAGRELAALLTLLDGLSASFRPTDSISA